MEELQKKSSFLADWLTSSSNRTLLILILVGVGLTGLGVLAFKSSLFEAPTKVEILSNNTEEKSGGELTVEIAGEVINPGVYKLPSNARIDDLLVAAGGLAADADRQTIEKYLNRAAKLTDGQKVYITSVNEQTLGVSASNQGGGQTVSSAFSAPVGGLTNINTVSLSELDKLPGIGPVYGQNIIDHRPYSNVEELVSRGAVTQSVYEKIKNLVSVY